MTTTRATTTMTTIVAIKMNSVFVTAAALFLCCLLCPGRPFTVPSQRITPQHRATTVPWTVLRSAVDSSADNPADSLETDASDEPSLSEHESTSPVATSTVPSQRRILGSQELLMLPRQYGPNPDVTFPQMNHVSCTVLSATPKEDVLRKAIDEVLAAHPLLRCSVEGDGEPNKRIDLFQMVREGEPNPCTFVAPDESPFSSDDILNVVEVNEEQTDPEGSAGSSNAGSFKDSLDASWQAAFRKDLDDGSWCNPTDGPLWKLEWHKPVDGKKGQSAFLLSFNHAISDQTSANLLMDQILANVADIEARGKVKPAVPQEIPIALEDSVLGKNSRFSDVQTGGFSLGTVKYVAGKAAEGFRSPVILPDDASGTDQDRGGGGGGLGGALTTISGNAAGGEDETSEQRQSVVQFRKLPKKSTDALLKRCRENGVAITNALTAAVTLTATDFIDNGTGSNQSRNYKVLQSMDMRRFGERLDGGETVACMAGSMDLMHGPFPDKSGEELRNDPSKDNIDMFWDLAKEGKEQTADFVDSDGPSEAVRVFDFAMTISDMNNLVDLTAKSKDSQGRAYSAGISNIGVYERQKAVRREGQENKERGNLKIRHGKYNIDDVYFATTHARTGCLYQVSTMTVDGEMRCTFNPASPIVSEETNAAFADAFMGVLETVANNKGTSSSSFNTWSLLPPLTALAGAGTVATHYDAYIDFYKSIMEMKANVADPADFWAAFNFWIFFAVGHPILQPILWISDVLHGSPGPRLAELVPYTFLAANVIVIGLVAFSKEIRNSVNIAALAAFFTYIGAGLDGDAGLGDFNLALDDSYKGQVVRGCPTYEQVRQPSMDGFDLTKYQGKWYEHKFHDWTQFKEVYDTTLDIKLTDGGWIDDFGVKGPAPDAAPLSWDKSPVANGAHYFLFGRVDPNDPPGILRESGFGVEFPNYIVDVQKDPATGEYKEAIQFQCLERGGVRVFEGINFMSRDADMTDEQLKAMHARAEKAGMYPYGASPSQMHRVARRPESAPPIDNEWQALWRAIGVDKLLELLTESIEDGGR